MIVIKEQEFDNGCIALIKNVTEYRVYELVYAQSTNWTSFDRLRDAEKHMEQLVCEKLILDIMNFDNSTF